MNLICIKCPRGCNINIDGDNITGNMCPRGLEYAKEELTTPKRIVTALAKSINGVVPVKTDKEVPKSMIFDILSKISKLNLNDVSIGDIVINNCLDTGANIIVTGNPMKR